MKKYIIIIFLITSMIVHSQESIRINVSSVSGDQNIIRPEYYGASNADIVDDWSAINSAIANSNGRQVVIGWDTTEIYYVSKPIVLTENLKLVINGKIKPTPGDSSRVTANILIGASTFNCYTPSKFSVGGWVAVSDNGDEGYKLYVRDKFMGWVGKITDITGNTITLNTVSPYNIYSHIDSAAFVSDINSIIYAENVNNISITGNGVIDGDRVNQFVRHPTRSISWDEEQRAGMCIAISNCRNVLIDGITFRNPICHGIAISSLAGVGEINQNIRLNNIKSFNAWDKCCIIRFTNNVEITNSTFEKTGWEDGLMFYGNVTNAKIFNITAKNCPRYGIGWNSAQNEYLTGSNIQTSGNGRGIAIVAKYVNLSNLIMNDPLMISNQYTCTDVNISNVVIRAASGATYPCLYFYGQVQRVNLSNIVINGCTGTAISSYDASGVPIDVHITGGGLYNHTGTSYSIAAGTDITWTAFDNQP